MEYVTCKICKSSDTLLDKENRLYFITCEACGSRKSFYSRACANLPVDSSVRTFCVCNQGRLPGADREESQGGISYCKMTGLHMHWNQQPMKNTH